MITDAILDMIAKLVDLATSKMPDFTLPDGALVKIADALDTGSDWATGLNGWLDIDTLLQALAFVSLCFSTSAAIRATRIGASHLSGGGGSAA